MSVFLSPFPRFQLGLDFIGYKLFTYAAGTLTKQSTFTDSTGATPNTNPIILDANGSASIYFTAGVLYKLVLALPTDTDPPTLPLWTQDQQVGINDVSVISYTPPGVGAVATSISAKLSQTVSLFDFLTAIQIADVQAGTVSVDCSVGIQAALNSGAPAVFAPPYNYRCSSGITVPTGVSFYSTGFQPTNPPSGCRLTFDLVTATCVTLGGSGASNGSLSMKGISVLRAAGSIPAGSIGILNQNTYATVIEDCATMRHAIPLELKNNQATLGITCYLERVFTGAATDSHLVIDSWPEAHFTNCRFGMNGAGDQNCNSYVRVQGGSTSNAGDGPDTIRFAQCQFNQGANTGTSWISFQNILPASLVLPTLIQFANCYVEDDVVGIATDSTVTSLIYLQITNLAFVPAATTRQFWSLNAATKLIDCEISNSNIQAAMTLTGATSAINFLSITSTSIGGACSFTGGNSSSANLIGNFYKNGLTLSGAWGGLNVIGGNIVGGSLTNTATGPVKVDLTPNNQLTTFTPGFTLGGASASMTFTTQTGGYQIFGNLVIGQLSVTLSAKGVSTGAAAVVLTGLPALSSLPMNPAGGGLVNFSANFSGLTAAPVILSIGAGPVLNLFQQGAAGVASVTDTNVTNTTALRGTFQYFM